MTDQTMSTESVKAAPHPGRRRRFSQLSRRDKIVLFVMVGVPTFLHVVLVWIPAILTGILSFMRWDNIRPVSTAELVGFRNYWEIFTIFDNQLFPALFNNLILVVWLFLCSAIGVLLAYLLDKNIKGTRFYQSVYYFPVVLSMAVVGFIWKSVMFNRDSGLLNILWPGKPVDFVGDQTKLFEIHLPLLDFPLGLSKNFAALLIAMAWRHIGYVMVLYLAGLKSFDPSLREAASIDGCNEWQTFRRVVFPGLKPINVVVAVITVIEALRAYDIVAALSEPRGTEVMGTLVTNSLMGEGGGYAGRGSAFGMVLFVLCIGFIIWYVINNFRERET
ncbi:MAG: sugar ABC transporter permease [Ilumatobacter sp.]|nr:sugar ABC transporter permease [Ilumatobacter sp.]MCB0984114.1 sugar ABC transporter permease [Ilumatobacter sp.]